MSEEETKRMIRSCLISTKGDISIRQLRKDFHLLVGGTIPFREYGFRIIEDYLRSIPDVVRMDESGPEIHLRFVADESTAGIASLVQRQRTAKRRAPPRRPISYVPRLWSAAGAGRRPGSFSAPRFNVQSQRTVNVRPSPRRSGPRPTLQPGSGPRWHAPTPQRPADTGSLHKPTPAPARTQPKQSPPQPKPQPAKPQPKPQSQPAQQQQQKRLPTPPARTPTPQSRQSPPLVNPALLEPRQAPAVSAQAWWGPAPAASVTPAAQAAAAAAAQAAAAAAAQAPTTAAQPGQETPPSGPVEELRQYVRQHNLPEAKLETVTFKPKKDRLAIFYATIVVGDIKCQTYPAENPSTSCAEKMACQMALDELRARQKDASVRDSPVTEDSQLIVSRIAQVLESRPNGLWRDSLPNEYRTRYGERVPHNWEELAYASGKVRFDCIGSDRFILYPTSNLPTADGEISRAAEPASAGGAGDGLARMEMAALPDDDLFPVYVTWVLSGSQLAFRIIGENNTDLLDDLLTEMEVAVLDTSEPVTPVIGGVYIANMDGTPHRVQVVDILDDMVSAFFVDIGDTELVPARSLAPLDMARFGRLPGQALHAQLSGVNAHRPGAKEALSRLVLRQSLICQVVEAGEGRLEVILFDTSGDDDVNINHKLREMADVVAPPALPAVGGLADAFIVHVPPCGGEVCVQLDTSSSADVNERVAAAGEAADSSPPAPALTGDLVLARYSDLNWYRARVLAPAVNHTVLVLFVDYGNQDSVGSGELRALPGDLAQYPGQALAVHLSGVPLTAERALRLIEMVPMDGTRVVLRVTALPSSSPPEVEAYKRLENNELVSINATLLIAPTSGRPDPVSRQSSVSAGTPTDGRPPAVFPGPEPQLRPNTTPTEKAPPAVTTPTELPFRAISPPTNQVARAAPSPTEQMALLSAADGQGEPGLPQYRVQLRDGYLDITVSFCSSPWNIYVQPYLEGGHLQALMRSMQEYYGDEANLQPLKLADVASGRICAVRKPEDNLWYRTRVETRLDNAQVTINFVDYGDFGYVPLEPTRIQPLPATFRQLPAQAVKARLGGVRPAGSDWTFADCVALQRLLGSGSGTFCAQLLRLSVDSITGEQLIVVRLVDTSDPVEDVYVDRLLVSAGHAVHTGEYYTT